MTLNRPALSALALLPALALLAACGGDSASGPVSPEAVAANLGGTPSSGPVLVECPAEVTRTASATIGTPGGTLELDGHRLHVPRGAVRGPTKFDLTVPASNYMEVEVHANGQQHFNFQTPATLTVDYSRCTRSNVDGELLRIFVVDETTGEILEDLGGVDDKVARTVTTVTPHLSGYSIGANRDGVAPSDSTAP